MLFQRVALFLDFIYLFTYLSLLWIFYLIIFIYNWSSGNSKLTSLPISFFLTDFNFCLWVFRVFFFFSPKLKLSGALGSWSRSIKWTQSSSMFNCIQDCFPMRNFVFCFSSDLTSKLHQGEGELLSWCSRQTEVTSIFCSADVPVVCSPAMSNTWRNHRETAVPLLTLLVAAFSSSSFSCWGSLLR